MLIIPEPVPSDLPPPPSLSGRLAAELGVSPARLPGRQDQDAAQAEPAPSGLPPAPSWADPELRDVAPTGDGGVVVTHAVDLGHGVELCRIDEDGESVTEVVLGGARWLSLDRATALGEALLAAVALARGGAR